MSTRAGFNVHLVLLSSLMMVGCAGNRVNLKERNQLKVAIAPHPLVVIAEPSVWQENGSTVVVGELRRAPGVFPPPEGHTHVQVFLLEEGIVEEQWVAWSPKWIPMRGRQFSSYRAAYPWVAPPGSNIRVWVCFDAHTSVPGGKVPTTRPD